MSARIRFKGFFRRWLVPGLIIPLSALSARASADEAPLTRVRVAELLRVAPSTRAAEAQTGVSRAAVAAAGVISLENPVISALGGMRLAPDSSRSASAVTALSVPIDLGAQSGAREDAAEADLRAATTAAESEVRRALLGALLQHALVLRDERQLALVRERRALAARLVAAAEKRRQAGSVGALDVTLASLQDRRDASLETSALGERDADRMELLTRLGLPPTEIAVAGDLVPSAEPPSLDALVAESERRVDVRAAAAEVDAARARASRERAARWPTLSLLAQYEHDDSANIGMLGVAIPLPLFNANRSAVAISAAEVDAANARLDVAKFEATGAIRRAWMRYSSTKAALETLAPTGALAAEAVSLSTRSYELGEGDLASVLLARREAIEAQLSLLEAEHAHASTKIEILVLSGRSVP
jgi:cobalt-zinc-cadmium efflux system outer membrane protein